MDAATRTRILNAISEEVQFDVSVLDLNRAIEEQVTLDSMQFVAVAARVERELDIELPLSVMECRTLNEFLSAISKELEAKRA